MTNNVPKTLNSVHGISAVNRDFPKGYAKSAEKFENQGVREDERERDN